MAQPVLSRTKPIFETADGLAVATSVDTCSEYRLS